MSGPTWNSSIPQPADKLSASQNLLLENNTTINTVFNDMNIGTFSKFVMQNPGSITGVSDPASALHSINGTGLTFNGKPIPFFKNSLGDYPLMADIQGTSPQFYFQLGNLIVYYGYLTEGASGSGSITLNFPKNFTSATSYSIVLTPWVTAGRAYPNVGVFSQAASNAVIYVGVSTQIEYFNYIAIGY